MEEQYRFGHWGQTSEEILSKQFPLHRACRDGDLEALSLLLVEAQHGIYEEDNFYGWTPAHWASYFGKLACLRKLMTTTRVGVNCNIRTSRFRQTPVHLAAFGGHPQCLLWLVSASADLNAQDYLGETALHKASRTGSMECISLLVSHGARLYIRNNSGQTAVELSRSCGHGEVTRYLEQAAQCPAAESGGVYNQQPGQHAVTTPSPHDVTATPRVHPCVITQGLNGGRLPPVGPHGDAPLGAGETDMEEGDPAPCPAAADGPVTDVTTHTGVTANVVSVGGRKRCLEDNDDVDHKRRRSDFSMGYNGVMTNGETNGFHQEPVVSRPWSDMSCESAPAAHWGPSLHPNTTTAPHHQHLITQPSATNGGHVSSSSPLNGHASLQSVSNGHANFQSVSNGHASLQSVTNGAGQTLTNGTNGHHVSSAGVGAGVWSSPWGLALPTSSMCEHRDSVMVEQGYDSMLHEDLTTRYYSHH